MPGYNNYFLPIDYIPFCFLQVNTAPLKIRNQEGYCGHQLLPAYHSFLLLLGIQLFFSQGITFYTCCVGPAAFFLSIDKWMILRFPSASYPDHSGRCRKYTWLSSLFWVLPGIFFMVKDIIKDSFTAMLVEWGFYTYSEPPFLLGLLRKAEPWEDIFYQGFSVGIWPSAIVRAG